MIVCRYIVLFTFYSFLGWVYETVYSTIVHHKFQSRGFLFGPIIPIYGLGACIATVIFLDLPIKQLHHLNNASIFVICFIGSIFLEYITSFILEKAFHARWWDYSNSFLNINGRVCFFASCGFGVAGIILVNGLFTDVNGFMDNVPKLLVEVIALICVFLLGMDLAVTISSLSNFTQNLERISDKFVSKMSQAYDSLEKNLGEKKAAIGEAGAGYLEEHEKVAWAVGKVQDASEGISEKASALSESLSDAKESVAEKTSALGESLVEKKEALLSSKSETKSIENKTDEIEEELERYVNSSSWLQRRALRNIKFFTYEGEKKGISERLSSKFKNNSKSKN